MTLENLSFDNEQDVLITAKEAVREIQQMAIEALSVVRKTMAGATLMTILLIGSFQQSAAAFTVENLQPQEIVIDTGREVPVVVDAVSAYMHHHRLQGRINELKNIPANWDGAGAYAPSVRSLSVACFIVNEFSEKVLSYCALFPSVDSSIFLQARFPKGRLTLNISDGVISYIVKNTERRDAVGPVGATAENIHQLMGIIEDNYL